MKFSLCSCFLARYLASKDDLMPLLRPFESREETLSRLWHLHLVTDLAFLLQTYLSPSQECLKDVVRRALASFDPEQAADAVQEPRLFQIDIQSSHVRAQLAK